jgi:hypothetical protein
VHGALVVVAVVRPLAKGLSMKSGFGVPRRGVGERVGTTLGNALNIAGVALHASPLPQLVPNGKPDRLTVPNSISHGREWTHRPITRRGGLWGVNGYYAVLVVIGFVLSPVSGYRRKGSVGGVRCGVIGCVGTTLYGSTLNGFAPAEALGSRWSGSDGEDK